MDYTHLYVETSYSMNGSNITCDNVVNKAKELGFPFLAITDKKMHGVIQFYKACKANEIKPIIGLSTLIEGVNPDARNNVLLYALDNEGYNNLLKLSTIESDNGYISLSTMKEHNDGILAIYLSDESEMHKYYTNNMKNEFVEVINSLNDNLNDYFFSVSKDKGLNDFFEKKKKLIYANKVEYLNKEDKEVSETLKQIFNKNINDLFEVKDDVYFKPFNEEEYTYKNALKNVSYVLKHCNVDIDFSKTYLPTYPLKKNVTSKEYLRALVLKGLEKRIKGKKVDKKLYMDRVNYELKVIDNMGYNNYFLIVWDFVKYARKKDYLVGPGRGSAAASLVSYCLGITSVDSIEYDLVFERFLNPERITLPDIDMDLPDDKRDDIISYVKDFYGKEKVASICTFGTFQSRSAIRDTARVLGIEGLIIDEVIKHLDGYESIAEAVNTSDTVQNIMARNKDAGKLIEIAKGLEGLVKHVSTHAAGVIVSALDLTDHTALQPGLLNMYQTQFEAKDLESLGLLKIDFLGLRNLTTIKNIVSLIEEKEGKKIDIYKVPLDDKLTFQLLKKVDVTGLFQLESQGMRSLIGQMQMKEFEDIVTVLALFRPGPMEMIPTYIKRRFGKEKVKYPHPILEDILKSTNGVIIYQEQIVKIASEFAGYTLGEADVLRRAVSKKQEDVLIEERKIFLERSLKQGHDKAVSNEIYDYIVKFSNYGFNRAHSVAYAMVSYWMAYLKANYPKYFIAILTSSVIGSEKQMRNYIFEAFKLGVKVKAPSVNYSDRIFSPEGNDLRYPLLGIKNVGLNTVNALLEEREKGLFKSYVDFVSRTHSFLNKRVIESLIKASALDEFGYTKRTMIEKLEEVINFTLLGGYIDSSEFVLKDMDEYDYDMLESFEFNILGFNLVMNPLNEYEEYVKKHNLKKPSTITKKDIGKEIRVIGLISFIRPIKTKTNKEMAFVTIQDGFSKLDGVLFNNVYTENVNILERNNVFLFMTRVEERNGNLQLVINKIHKMD